MTAFLSAMAAACAAAVVASLHCLGMCGGFAVALGAGAEPSGGWRIVARHAIYHVGKATSYVFLGVLAASAGAWLVDSSGFRWAQTALSAGAGLLMIAVGLQLLGLWPGRRGAGALSAWVWPLFQPLLRPRGATGPLALGVFNGFLPCPLVYAFVAQAAATRHPVLGAAIMLGLAMATIPALSLAGVAGRRLTGGRRAALGRVAGALIVIFGVVTAVRGFPGLHGAHSHAAAGPAGSPAETLQEHDH